MGANTIMLRGNKGHRLEYAAAGTIKPGHLLQWGSAGMLVVHATYAGKAERMFALEDYLQGNVITTAYASGDLVFVYDALPGDIINARCPANAVALVTGDNVISNGDGTLVKATLIPNGVLYSATAASNTVTNTTVETAFSNSTYTIPANSLQAGDVIRIRGQGLVVGAANTDTITIKVKLGSTAILTSPAPDTVTNDIFVFDTDLIIRTIGASGTFVAGGTASIQTPSAAAGAADITAPSFVGSTAINTTTTNAITVTVTWSVADTADQARLDVLTIELYRPTTGGSFDIIGKVHEAVDNSAGSAEAMLPIRILG